MTFSFSPEEVSAFAVILFRVAGIMFFAPFYSTSAFPSRVKVIIPLVTALALAPSVPRAALPAGYGLAQIVLAMAGEVLIGIVLGLTAAFLFAGVQLAGQIIGFELGFSIVNVIDPQSDVEVSVISILQNFIGLMLFLLMNGHHWFFKAVSDSLEYLPPGGVHLDGPIVQEMIRLSSEIFVSGLRIAAPVVAVVIISDIVLGIIGRAAPQINILIVGMPVKTFVGLIGLSLSFYFLPQYFESAFLGLARELMGILHGLA